MFLQTVTGYSGVATISGSKIMRKCNVKCNGPHQLNHKNSMRVLFVMVVPGCGGMEGRTKMDATRESMSWSVQFVTVQEA